MPKTDLGAHIRTLRLSRELSQEQLAEKAGMHVQTLSRIERGTSHPSLEHAVALAKGLEVGAEAFFAPLLPRDDRGDAIRRRLLALPAGHQELVLKIIDAYTEGVGLGQGARPR